MGKSPVPLVIWCDAEFGSHGKMADLVAKGHTVYTLPFIAPAGIALPDLILSRAAWNWDEEQWKFLEVTLKAARARKKGAA